MQERFETIFSSTAVPAALSNYFLRNFCKNIDGGVLSAIMRL